jgi:hypothetical protein
MAAIFLPGIEDSLISSSPGGELAESLNPALTLPRIQPGAQGAREPDLWYILLTEWFFDRIVWIPVWPR